jgi:hypothetical protein
MLKNLTRKYLPMEEIDKYFRGYWVIMVDTINTECGIITGGKIWYYNKDKGKLMRHIDEFKGKSSTHIYIGELEDKGVSFLL